MVNISLPVVKKLLNIWLAVSILVATAQVGIAQNAIDAALLQQFNIRTINGQKVVEMSMKALLQMALERATALETIALNQQIAEEALAASQESRNPTLTNSISMSKSIYGSTDSSYYLVFSDTQAASITSSLSQELGNGVTYGLTVTESISQTKSGTLPTEESFSGWSNTADALHSSVIMASVAIPLYQNWGDINKVSEYQSAIALDQANISGEKSTQELLSLIAGTYWDLVGVLKTIEFLESNVHLSHQFLKDNQVRYESELLDIVEVKQSESQLAQARQALQQEKVKKEQVEDQIRAALNLESLPMGYLPVEKLKIKKVEKKFTDLLQRIFETDHTLKLLEESLKLNGLDQKAALNSDKPNLDLNLSYSFSGFGKSAEESFSGISKELNGYSVGLTWTIPLFDRVTPQKIQKTVLERAKIDVDIRNRKTELNVELRAVLRNLKLAKEGIELAEISTSLSKDLLEKESENYRIGNSTSYRVSQVRQDLLDAQKDEIVARVNFERIFLSFLVLTNQLITHYQL